MSSHPRVDAALRRVIGIGKAPDKTDSDSAPS